MPSGYVFVMPYDTDFSEYHARYASQPLDIVAASGKKTKSLYRNYTKLALDIALVVLCLPVVLPLIAVAAFLVALDGHNPFYTQQRVGRNGKSFSILKLRSMVPNADAMLATYLNANPAARAEWDADQKLKNDPRITRVGRILRKTSLDELPQLFNVLKGEMSLVGPRPMMVEQKEMYSGHGYYQLRPGLTGFWQISDRNNCEFRDRVKYDELYNRELSFGADIAVILRTFQVVLRGTGY